MVKGNVIVFLYVFEYLFGQYCVISDEVMIQMGIEMVKEILVKYYVYCNEVGLVCFNIKEKGCYKVIDKISVVLNEKMDVYEVQFFNLGIKKVLVDFGIVKVYFKLLVSGVWCIVDIEYVFFEDQNVSFWILFIFKLIQLFYFDYDVYVVVWQQFSIDEWIDLLIQSIGFNLEMFGWRSKFFQFLCLVFFCECNYNLIEFGFKGIGKFYVYFEFLFYGILVLGGEVIVFKLFVNNFSGKIGLVGYWDCVVFDEFVGKQKCVDKVLVDIMKNYMVNKFFFWGVEILGVEVFMVFVGNIWYIVFYMFKYLDLFDELLDKFYDFVFLDWIYFYIFGWEVDIIWGEMFFDGYGFVVDYFVEILCLMWNYDYFDQYWEYFIFFLDILICDWDGINKIFLGLMKILFFQGGVIREEVEEVLCFVIEGCKWVKDQLQWIDIIYGEVCFFYQDQ